MKEQEQDNIELENYLNQQEEEEQEEYFYEQDNQEIDLELIKKFKSLTPEEIEIEIIKTLEEVRPFLMQDGGDYEYVGFENSIVKIRLKGACTSCSQSTYTLKLGIENFLKERIPVVYEVEAID